LNIGKMDAIICAAGEAKWGNFSELKEVDFYVGIFPRSHPNTNG